MSEIKHCPYCKYCIENVYRDGWDNSEYTVLICTRTGDAVDIHNHCICFEEKE